MLTKSWSVSVNLKSTHWAISSTANEINMGLPSQPSLSQSASNDTDNSFGNVLDQLIKQHSVEDINRDQNGLQYIFPNMASLILTEALAEAKEMKRSLYMLNGCSEGLWCYPSWQPRVKHPGAGLPSSSTLANSTSMFTEPSFTPGINMCGSNTSSSW